MFSQFDSVDPESDHHWNEKVVYQILPPFQKRISNTKSLLQFIEGISANVNN